MPRQEFKSLSEGGSDATSVGARAWQNAEERGYAYHATRAVMLAASEPRHGSEPPAGGVAFYEGAPPIFHIHRRMISLRRCRRDAYHVIALSRESY